MWVSLKARSDVFYRNTGSARPTASTRASAAKPLIMAVVVLISRWWKEKESECVIYSASRPWKKGEKGEK